MKNMNLLRGVFLTLIALVFGLTSMSYKIGDFSRAGPALFPLMMSGMLLLIGIAAIIRSQFVPPEPVDYQFKNIALILLSLVGFALISEHVNMILGIFFLVFCSSYAGQTQSPIRSLKIVAGLVGVALAFKYGLHLNLPLI